MTQDAESLDHEIVEILIGVDEGHCLSRLRVAADETVDLVSMRFVVLPGRGQVRRSQTGDRVQDFGVAPAKASPFDQPPDVDVGVPNAGLNAVRVRAARDPGCLRHRGYFLLGSYYQLTMNGTDGESGCDRP